MSNPTNSRNEEENARALARFILWARRNLIAFGAILVVMAGGTTTVVNRVYPSFDSSKMDTLITVQGRLVKNQDDMKVALREQKDEIALVTNQVVFTNKLVQRLGGADKALKSLKRDEDKMKKDKQKEDEYLGTAKPQTKVDKRLSAGAVTWP